MLSSYKSPLPSLYFALNTGATVPLRIHHQSLGEMSLAGADLY
jgi:hypothetical protein